VDRALLPVARRHGLVVCLHSGRPAVARYAGRRLLFVAAVYVMIVFVTHMGMRMIRNSELPRPNYDLVEHAQYAWQATRRTLRALLGGDLGTVRIASGLVPVGSYVREAYVNSMGLTALAMLSASAFGVALGVVAALARQRALSLGLLAVTVVGISAPSFFVGLLLRVGELYYLRTFGRRLVSIAGFGWDLEHMLLPAFVLAARPLAYIMRTTYISTEHVLAEDYVRTAFAKGLPVRLTVLRHALRNAAIPVLTAVGVSLRFSLSSLPVVEFLFSWPGLGRNLLSAIGERQTSLVIALVSALGLTLLGTNLALDLLYRAIDPRVRES
jgi:ABC-type dipeptide/oligopeptide/nickel transport system permease component